MCVLALTLCTFDLKKGYLFALNWIIVLSFCGVFSDYGCVFMSFSVMTFGLVLMFVVYKVLFIGSVFVCVVDVIGIVVCLICDTCCLRCSWNDSCFVVYVLCIMLQFVMLRFVLYKVYICKK